MSEQPQSPRSDREQRDHWIRLFNRMDAAITHHRKAKLTGVDTSDEADEALWKVRDKLLRVASERVGDAIEVALDDYPALGQKRPESGS